MKMWRRRPPDTVRAYLREYGDIPLAQRPMNDVDSLILCQLAYLKFDGLAPGLWEDKDPVRLSELCGHPLRDRLFADERFEKDNRELFEGMISGRRFRDIKLNCHVNIVERERETQFCAITIFPGDGTMYVAFRGTDETIVGWKEAFNMMFLSPVPGQALGAAYLNTVGERFSEPLYVGGHSKGGNFAVYGAMNCSRPVQDRILKIYSMDGPGFRPETLKECGYERIADRVVKILPHSSMVGMLFERDGGYRVVRSHSFGPAQHDPCHWKIENGEFAAAEGLHAWARLSANVVNEWIVSQDEQRLGLLADTLYRIVSASEAQDLIAMAAHWQKSLRGMRAAFREADRDTMKMLREMLGGLLGLAWERFGEEFSGLFKKPGASAEGGPRPEKTTKAASPAASSGRG